MSSINVLLKNFPWKVLARIKGLRVLISKGNDYTRDFVNEKYALFPSCLRKNKDIVHYASQLNLLSLEDYTKHDIYCMYTFTYQ